MKFTNLTIFIDKLDWYMCICSRVAVSLFICASLADSSSFKHTRAGGMFGSLFRKKKDYFIQELILVILLFKKGLENINASLRIEIWYIILFFFSKKSFKKEKTIEKF